VGESPSLNVDPSTATVGEFKAFVDAEYERWARRYDAKIKAE
jgi:hypothetical protein